MGKIPVCLSLSYLLLALPVHAAHGQSSSWAAGAAGGLAGNALGGAFNSNAGATTPSSSSAGGGASGPPEINNIVYYGLARLAKNISDVTQRDLCKDDPCSLELPRPLLIEDSISATQIGLYQTLRAYHGQLKILRDDLDLSFSLSPYSSAMQFDPPKYATQTLPLKNVSQRPIAGIDFVTGGPDFEVQTKQDKDNPDCPDPLKPGEICKVTVQLLQHTTPVRYLIGVVVANPVDKSHPRRLVSLIQVSSTVAVTEAPKKDKPANAAPPRADSGAPPVAAEQPKKPAVKYILQAAPFANQQLQIESIQSVVGGGAPLVLPAGPPAAGAAASPPATGPGTSGTAGTGQTTGQGSSAVTPPWITNTGALGTALEGLKTGMTYTPASAQPATQSLIVLLQNELQRAYLAPFTSTSMLDLGDTATRLAHVYGEMLAYGFEVNAWTAVCKPQTLTTGPQLADQGTQGAQNKSNRNSTGDTLAPAPACSSPYTVNNLAVASQLLSGYTTFIQSQSDSLGNPTQLDVIRGARLSQIFEIYDCRRDPKVIGAAPEEKKLAMDECRTRMIPSIPSLQVSVAAAGGSTRVNSIYLLNIFYVPKPSFNGGAIVSFELRSGANDLLESGVRTAFYDYNKTWKGDTLPNLRETSTCTRTAEAFCVPAEAK